MFVTDHDGIAAAGLRAGVVPAPNNFKDAGAAALPEP
jgi:hypothetical protein